MFLCIFLFVTWWLNFQTLAQDIAVPCLYPVDNGMVNEGLSNVTWRYPSYSTPGVASLRCLPCGKEVKKPVAWLTGHLQLLGLLMGWADKWVCKWLLFRRLWFWKSLCGWYQWVTLEEEAKCLLKYLQQHWWQCSYPAVWHLLCWTVLEKPSS